MAVDSSLMGLSVTVGQVIIVASSTTCRGRVGRSLPHVCAIHGRVLELRNGSAACVRPALDLCTRQIMLRAWRSLYDPHARPLGPLL